MNILRRTAVLMTGTTLAAGAAVIAAAAPAQAWPTGCHQERVTSWLGYDGYQSWCESGAGQHRIGIHCTRPDGSGYDRNGPWTNTGGPSRTSVAYCGGGFDPDVVAYHWLEQHG
jgi:hypothetical protein